MILNLFFNSKSLSLRTERRKIWVPKNNKMEEW